MGDLALFHGQITLKYVYFNHIRKYLTATPQCEHCECVATAPRHKTIVLEIKIAFEEVLFLFAPKVAIAFSQS